jgi:uncharacterized protein YlzI (FlbEa/FlbD family)
MRTIELTKVDTRAAQAAVDHYAETDDVGENAGAPQPQQPAEVGSPCAINIDAIRCFYARREARPGTRITFTDGGGFIVAETYDEVKSRVEAARAA